MQERTGSRSAIVRLYAEYVFVPQVAPRDAAGPARSVVPRRTRRVGVLDCVFVCVGQESGAN